MSHRRVLSSALLLGAATLLISCSSGDGDGTSASAQVAPSIYTAYSGTDPRPAPSPPPDLGPANSIFVDPAFGSRILRVTDSHTANGTSFIPEDAGFVRSWNANSTAVKLVTSNGSSYWADFDPVNFQAGVLHPIKFNAKWEWSASDSSTIYFLDGPQLSRYNTATQTVSPLGGTPNGDPVKHHVAVVGQDNWICSAAGAGSQGTYTKIFCVNPSSSEIRYIDVVNRTINGAAQHDPNWPTSAAGQTLGIHSLYGSAGGTWLGVCFHQASWSHNGGAVLNLDTNTWSLVTSADTYSSGHTSIGNDKFVNGSGSINGKDSRGAVVRNPNDLMNAAQYTFIMQPYATSGWYDGEHSSWFNASTNPNAPILFSRYDIGTPPSKLPWIGEILLAATDGSNTVWRFAHNHNGGGSYYGSAFAQISNDGRWALFSSYWGGTLGASNGDFGLPTRLDTFIVELK
ncbi:MAG TPA: hypothetical protein VJL88_16370 [Nitrospira sp.]|nr:hypothetical protein [Nitrospira sp.]